MRQANLFSDVYSLTNIYWQHTGKNIDSREKEVLTLISEADAVRSYLGVRAEYTEYNKDNCLDEFADIIFYYSRVLEYFGINQPTPRAGTWGDIATELNKCDQPMRNLLRPSAFRAKDENILFPALIKIGGLLLTYAQFKGYTNDMILNSLDMKLGKRYK